jgi:hypothetical protein
MASTAVALLPGENPDIRVDLHELLSNADEWLTTPNLQFSGRAPEELIGTPDEFLLREMVAPLCTAAWHEPFVGFPFINLLHFSSLISERSSPLSVHRTFLMRHTPSDLSRYYEGPTSAIPFDTIYLAGNPMIALFEVGALFGSPVVPGGVIAKPGPSWLVVNMQVNPTKVADLIDVTASHALLSTVHRN